jgi:hypothetical protein
VSTCNDEIHIKWEGRDDAASLICEWFRHVLKNTKPKLRDFLDMLKDHEKELVQFLCHKDFLDRIKQEQSMHFDEQHLDKATHELELQRFMDGIDRKRTRVLERINIKKPGIYS